MKLGEIVCRCCLKSLPVDGFSIRNGNPLKICKACRVKKQIEYQRTEKGKAVMALAHKRYNKTEKRINAERQRRASEHHKEVKRIYEKTEQGKESRKKSYKKLYGLFPERYAEYFRRHRSKKEWYGAYHAAKHRAIKRQASPKWTTEKHKHDIAQYYAMAKALTLIYGIKYEVDHIWPLAGTSASGLHLPWNLSVMPRYFNRSKGNKVPEYAN